MFVYLLVIFTFFIFFYQFWWFGPTPSLNFKPIYLSSFTRFNCQLSRQDLRWHVSTRTQAIFQALFDSIANYQWLKLRLYTQPGPALNATQGHKHPIDVRLTLRLNCTQAISQLVSQLVRQQGPKLSSKLSIQLPIIKARSTLVCYNKNPSYLSSYIWFNCQLSRQDLRLYVLTKTQSIFKLYLIQC